MADKKEGIALVPLRVGKTWVQPGETFDRGAISDKAWKAHVAKGHATDPKAAAKAAKEAATPPKPAKTKGGKGK